MGVQTARDAVAAQLLGDLGGLVSRVEALPAQVLELESSLRATTLALADGGDKFRMAVTASTDQAKAELVDYMRRQASQITASTSADLVVAMEAAAAKAFRSEASDKAAALGIALAAAAKAFNRRRWVRYAELLATACLTSVLTAWVLLFVLKGGQSV